MAVPFSIMAEVQTLSDAFNAATPLASATRGQVFGLREASVSLVAVVDAAVLADDAPITDFAEPSDQNAVAAAVLSLLSTVQEQASLTELRGLVGRVASNLAQQVY